MGTITNGRRDIEQPGSELKWGRMKRLLDHSAFTLIEAVLTLVLLSILAIPSSHFLTEGIDSYFFEFERIKTTEDARYTMQRIKQELMYLNSASILQTTPTRLDYLDQTSQQTSLALQGTDLYRGADLLSQNVQSLSFAYYDQNGSATFTPSAVRRIAVQVDLIANAGAPPVNYRVDVYPRNFMYQNFQ